MQRKNRVYLDRVIKAAEMDPQYQKMLLKIRTAEKKYDSVLSTLSMEKQDVIFDFVSLCEEMSWRMLELACSIDDKSPPE